MVYHDHETYNFYFDGPEVALTRSQGGSMEDFLKKGFILTTFMSCFLAMMAVQFLNKLTAGWWPFVAIAVAGGYLAWKKWGPKK